VIAPIKLFETCSPALALVDRTLLLRTGGLAFDLEARSVRVVADSEGEHPWWRFPHRMQRPVVDTGPEAAPPEAFATEAAAAAQ